VDCIGRVGVDQHGSIYYTNILVNQLKDRERAQVRLFAKALEYTIDENDNAILFISEEIISKNNSIPTILVDGSGSAIFFEFCHHPTRSIHL
jgi:hypothetical protein